MSGIAGVVSLSACQSANSDLAYAMVRTLAHRGASCRDLWARGPVALGVTANGKNDESPGQPFVLTLGEDPYAVVWDGTIDNLADIRRQLLLAGHPFKGCNPCETLIKAYLAWGPDCARYLNGVFAIALWDGPHRTLSLMRDVMGAKPLFYHADRDRLVFASQIKGLLACPGVEPVLDEEGLLDLVTLGPVRTPGQGIFRNVREVLPGGRVTFCRGAYSESMDCRIPICCHQEPLDDTAQRLRELLAGAVRRQLSPDGATGVLLSGDEPGFSLATLAGQQYDLAGCRLKTFSMDCAGYGYPSQGAPASSALCESVIQGKTRYPGSAHHTVVLEADELTQNLREALRLRDLPGPADHDAALLLTLRQAATLAPSLLCAVGADTLLAGHDWQARPPQEGTTLPWPCNLALRRNLLSPYLRRHLDLTAYAAARREELMAQAPFQEPMESPTSQPADWLTLRLYTATMLDSLERMAAAAGLEVRLPFFDAGVVRYSWNIPDDMKRVQGRNPSLLRLAMVNTIPADRKSPRAITDYVTFNLRYNELVSMLLEKEMSHPGPMVEIFDEKIIFALIHQEITLSEPWCGPLIKSGSQLLGYLLQFVWWLEDYHVTLNF